MTNCELPSFLAEEKLSSTIHRFFYDVYLVQILSSCLVINKITV